MPAEVHEHFDEHDRPCRAADAFVTVVTRESEWDEASRGRALRLAEYEEDMCTCGCGQSMSDAHDPSSIWLVDTFTCLAGKAVEQVKRQHREEAEEAKRADGWDDGKHYYPRKPTKQELAKKSPAVKRK